MRKPAIKFKTLIFERHRQREWEIKNTNANTKSFLGCYYLNRNIRLKGNISVFKRNKRSLVNLEFCVEKQENTF